MSDVLNIVIVTYENRDLLEKCVETVQQAVKNISINYVITVVDNASNDDTEKLIKEKYIDKIDYIKNKENYGLAKALNIGIKKHFYSKYTMLLNDDVLLFPDTIDRMLKTIMNYNNIYGIPAVLINPDGTSQWMKTKIIGGGYISTSKIKFVKFASTTACLYKTEIFRKIGLFDEFYFFYNEDLDFSLRAKRNGIKFILDPTIKVIHYGKQGRTKAKNIIKPYFYINDYYFYRKNFGIIFSVGYLIMALIHIFFQKLRFLKSDDRHNLALLKKSKNKLWDIVRNYKTHIK